MARVNQTQPTADVDGFLDAVEPAARREDARAVCALMSRASGLTPRMWGPAIVGFGERRYGLAGGREGTMPAVAFSPRKAALVLYGLGVAEDEGAVQALGEVTTGKGCVYVKSLARIDAAALEALVARRAGRGSD